MFNIIFRILFGSGDSGFNTIEPAQLLGLAMRVSMTFTITAAEADVRIEFESEQSAQQLAQSLTNMQIPCTHRGAVVMIPFNAIEGEFDFSGDED